ncbi:hypothetical protein [Halomonas alkalicola]|uniref:hypothetical protein n=1 Tax=Halomonas alkalicola TaxID=1930622 RepID=UPI0026604F1D|nr:hypothetical protein [Halomonas alkalicola]
MSAGRRRANFQTPTADGMSTKVECLMGNLLKIRFFPCCGVVIAVFQDLASHAPFRPRPEPPPMSGRPNGHAGKQ